MTKERWADALVEEARKRGVVPGSHNAPQAPRMAPNFNEAPLIRVNPRPREYRSKLEAEYAAWLEMRRVAEEIAEWRYECWRFRLADDTTLTPDFVVRMPDNTLELHETKGYRGGHMEDGWVKLKVAADQYRWFRWFLVTKDKRGWNLREV